MIDQERRDNFERKQEEIRQKATRVCEIYAEGTPIDKACALEGLPISAFFRAKRDCPDISKAFYEAKEILAELRVAAMDELKGQMLAGEIDPQVFSAAVKSDQWVISRLRPDLFGTKTTVDVSGTIEHSPAKVLAGMSDEQLLELARAAALPAPDTGRQPEPTPAIPLNVVDADYDEIVVDTDEQVDYNSIVDSPIITSAGAATHHTEADRNAPTTIGLGVNLTALGGTDNLGGHHGQ